MTLRNKLIIYFNLVMVSILVSVGVMSYNWTRATLEKRVTESTLENLRQIDKNMSLIMSDVQNISLFVVASRDIRSYARVSRQEVESGVGVQEKLNEDFASITNAKPYITSINFVSQNGLSIETAGPSSVEDNQLVVGYEASLPVNGNAVLTRTYQRHYSAVGIKYVFSLYREINNVNHFTEKLGRLRIDVDEAAFNSIYRDIRLGDTGYIFGTDTNGYVMTHSDKSMIGRKVSADPVFSVAMAQPEGFQRVQTARGEMLVTWLASGSTGMRMISVVPFSELLGEVNQAREMTAILIIVGAMVSIFISFLIAQQITTPVKRLIQLMKQVEDGDLDVVVAIRRRDEIGRLGESFNRMIRTLNTMIEEVYKNNISRKEAELRALQAQINPHFLYNTLDVIYWTSRTEGAPQTGQIVTALSRLFRLGLNKGKEMTTIANEMEHLQSYLLIQRMRYDVPPEIVVEVEPAILPLQTVKLVLQPLVENALIHGIRDMGDAGSIRVFGWQEGDTIHFEVSDNGTGMTEEQIRRVSEPGETGGYGLRNVRERIQLRYGDGYGMKITSGPGGGTLIHLTWPVRME